MSRTTWSNLLPPHRRNSSRPPLTPALTSTPEDTAGVPTQVSAADVGPERRRFLPVPRVAMRRFWRQMSAAAAPRAPPRSLLRVRRLLPRRVRPALTKGHSWSVSAGRSEASEVLPRPSGSVAPDVALRSSPLRSLLSSPLLSSPLLSSAPPGGSRRTGGRCDATFVRSSGACVARMVGSLDSPVNTRQSAFYSKNRRQKAAWPRGWVQPDAALITSMFLL